MGKSDDIRTTRQEDEATEAAVLQHLLALHPGPLTVEELTRELASEAGDFGERDAIERAVRDLMGCGLLHRSEALLLPSRAALRFHELLGE